MRIVFALGGSVVCPNDIDEEYISRFSQFALSIARKNTIGIVVGGGKRARDAIKRARLQGSNEVECDYAGIEASRENARRLAEAMGIEEPIPETLREAKQVLETEGIVIMGGTEPGHSTDTVAILLGEYINADMVLKVSDVDGVYDKDPQKFGDAKRYDVLPLSKLEKISLSLSQRAGKYELLDVMAIKILRRSSIKLIVLNGHDLDNLRHAIEGKPFIGTTIQSP